MSFGEKIQPLRARSSGGEGDLNEEQKGSTRSPFPGLQQHLGFGLWDTDSPDCHTLCHLLCRARKGHPPNQSGLSAPLPQYLCEAGRDFPRWTRNWTFHWFHLLSPQTRTLFRTETSCFFLLNNVTLLVYDSHGGQRSIAFWSTPEILKLGLKFFQLLLVDLGWAHLSDPQVPCL